MREKKFTAGPWNFHAGFKFYRQNGEYFMFEVGENACSNLCKYDEQWRANANLIAAAPELLEALEGLLVLCKLELIEDSLTDIYKAESAIAKAYGEQP